MSFEMLWGEERKCSATVVGLDLVLALSKVRRCSLIKIVFYINKRRLVSPMYCKWHLLHNDFSFASYVEINGARFASREECAVG